MKTNNLKTKIDPDKEVVDSVKALSEAKMKQVFKLQLNKLLPFVTPPTAKARDNSNYIIYEKKLSILLGIYEKYND
jgi:hypothetical protein